MITFYISTAPDVYGDECTPSQARRLADIICQRANDFIRERGWTGLIIAEIGESDNDHCDAQIFELDNYITYYWPDWVPTDIYDDSLADITAD